MTQLINSDVVVHWVLVDSGRVDLGSLTRRRPRPPPGRFTPPRRHSPAGCGDRTGTDSTGHDRSSDSSTATVAAFALLVLVPVVCPGCRGDFGDDRPADFLHAGAGRAGGPAVPDHQVSQHAARRRNATTGPIWASDHDTRCTRIGDWLRHTNIDELPQLLNVLRGEMSLVGPRPERPSFVEHFRQTIPDYDLRHAVPGGMTGWAQVHGWRGRTSLRKRIQYDLDYIERWSLGLDLRILLMTVQHVFWGKTSWNESKRPVKISGVTESSSCTGSCPPRAALFGRDTDLQRPRAC